MHSPLGFMNRMPVSGDPHAQVTTTIHCEAQTGGQRRVAQAVKKKRGGDHPAPVVQEAMFHHLNVSETRAVAPSSIAVWFTADDVDNKQSPSSQHVGKLFHTYIISPFP